ncbi:hypothetical protein EON66_11550 [archaeon]|nr:MAG: hypothetical protein EON66_11550 [archaeon]
MQGHASDAGMSTDTATAEEVAGRESRSFAGVNTSAGTMERQSRNSGMTADDLVSSPTPMFQIGDATPADRSPAVSPPSSPVGGMRVNSSELLPHKRTAASLLTASHGTHELSDAVPAPIATGATSSERAPTSAPAAAKRARYER